MNLEWAHVVIGLLGVLGGAGGGIFAGGWRLGRIESRLKLHLKEKLDDCERRFEDKVDRSVEAFDETLKGLRQKINDVELDAVRNFVAKKDFTEFREEYREDMREVKAMISTRNGHK